MRHPARARLSRTHLLSRAAASCAAVAAIMLLTSAAPGEEEKTPPAARQGSAKKSAQAGSAGERQVAEIPPAALAPPGPDLILVLVRTTLLTLNDALRSDNFTVLRDLAAPEFRAANTAGRLAQAFSDLARRGIDLTAVAILAPELAELPSLDKQKGVLRLKGYFGGKPVRIEFELVYRAEGGRWLLLGLSVQPVAVSADAAVEPGQPAPPKAP
jgi:hypothetical protein